MGQASYRVFDAESEMLAVARLISLAFASPPDKATEWLRASPSENIRVLGIPGHDPAACLLRIPMGQYFGRRAVPMVGVAGVAVAPESRGRGHALSMMSELVREVAREGVPLTALYASTQALYRQVGFEQAGHRFATTIPIHALKTAVPASRTLTVRPLTDADTELVRGCHARFAREFNGSLDRGEYIWNRIRKWRDEVFHGFGIDDGQGGLAGHVFFAQTRKPTSGKHDLTVSDLAFLTPDAGRALVAFLAGFGTMADSVILHGGPMHPIVSLLAQQSFEVSKRDYWMLRITDLAGALTARAYSASVRVSLGLDISDALVPANAGLWTLAILNGRCAVERAARGTPGLPVLHTDIRGFAAVYSGLYSARQAALLGLVSGDEAAVDAGDAAFAGSTPWMSDFF